MMFGRRKKNNGGPRPFMAAAVIIHRKRTERGHQTLDDDAGELDDDVGERVPEPGQDCRHEGVLERKIVSTRSHEVQWQQRLLVLGKDKLFFCKTSDRQHVYDHIPLSEIVDVEAFSGQLSHSDGCLPRKMYCAGV